MSRYNKLNEYLKERFGERVLKICIDGNFTCPNRDGKCGTGGCIFCGERGSGEHIHPSINSDNLPNTQESIKNQVLQYLSSYKSTRANKFIAYFQNFSNTYDTIPNLQKRYDSALIDSRIIGLSIATRPDLINEEICKLLKSYADKYYVVIELGLQTSNNDTGKLINRRYTSEDFTKAVTLLNKYNIDVVAHIMVGLPNEGFSELKQTVAFLNNHKLQGIKIHSTYIIKGTRLEDLYIDGKYTPLRLEEYIKQVTYIISHISKSFIIHRISGDAPKDLLVAPEWNLHKKWIINGIDKSLRENDIYQGDAKF